MRDDDDEYDTARTRHGNGNRDGSSLHPAVLRAVVADDNPVRDLAQGRGSATAHGRPKSTLAISEPRWAKYSQNLSQLQSPVGQSSCSSPNRSRFQLSVREVEIMDLIVSGVNNQRIAATRFSTSRSEATAKWLGLGSE